MIILKDLLDKYKIDYTNFPEDILGIEFNQELDNFDTFTHEKKDVYIFSGEYLFRQLEDRDLIAEVEVKIDLRNLPSKKKINIVKDIFNSTEDIKPEKYGLSMDEIGMMMHEVNRKKVVFYHKNVKGNTFANYYNYNLFGDLKAHS